MKQKLRIFFLLSIFLGSIFFISACSSETTTTSIEPTTRLINYSEENITQSMNELKADYESLKERVNVSTTEDANGIKEDINQLKTNIKSFDSELETAVDNNKLSQEVKKTYDVDIETMKTNLDKLNAALDEK